MKTHLSYLPVFLMCLLPLSWQGCTSPGTYNTLAAVGLAVSTGIDEFAKAELKGQVDAATSEKVWAAYAEYRQAYNYAIDVAKLTPEKPSTREVLLTSRAVLDMIEPLLLKSP